MGKRGYILLKTDTTFFNKSDNEDKIWELIRKIENIEDVEFASNTIGKYDFLITIDTNETIESAAKKVEKILPEWIEETLLLTENNLFKKHRELKDLEIFNNMH